MRFLFLSVGVIRYQLDDLSLFLKSLSPDNDSRRRRNIKHNSISYFIRLLPQFLNAVQIRGDVAIDDLIFIIEEGKMGVFVQKHLSRSLCSIHSAEEATQRDRI
jgi:hypothetical protein